MKVALRRALGLSAPRLRRPRAARLRPRARAGRPRRRASRWSRSRRPTAEVWSPRRPSIRPSAWSSCRTTRSRAPDAAGPRCSIAARRIRSSGLRAGRRALDLVRDGRADIVHGSARACSAMPDIGPAFAPAVTVQRFGGTRQRDGAAGAESAGARGIRRDRSVARAAQARGLPAAAAGGPHLRGARPTP